MGLGLSKSFIIFVFLSFGLGYLTKNWVTGLSLLVIYGIVKVVWNFLTK